MPTHQLSFNFFFFFSLLKILILFANFTVRFADDPNLCFLIFSCHGVLKARKGQLKRLCREACMVICVFFLGFCDPFSVLIIHFFVCFKRVNNCSVNALLTVFQTHPFSGFTSHFDAS